MSHWSNPLHFSSLDEMLAPEILARFAGFSANPPVIVSREAITGGFSGATIERITIHEGEAEQSFIVKHLDCEHDWLMIASGDTVCREVQFARSALYEQLPSEIAVPILATAYTNHSGALLMPHLAHVLFDAPMCYAAADDALAGRVIDHLAALHARFWEHPALARSEWLVTPFNALLALTPIRLQLLLTREQSDEIAYGINALKRWFFLWRYLDPVDAAAIQHVLSRPEAILRSLQSAPATLAHGDAWLANLGEDQERLILLDWALATAGPATYDSLWFAHTWQGLDPDHVLAMHRAALLRHGIAAVEDEVAWSLLADLGWIRTTLMGIEWLVHEIITSTHAQDYDKAIRRLNLWCGRAAKIIRERGW